MGYLITAFRIPVGLAGSLVVSSFFLVWLLLETLLAVIVFPVAAVFSHREWIRKSWLGRYPISFREFSQDGFKSLRRIWDWVADPTQGVDLDTPISTQVQTQPNANHEGFWGCLFLVLIAGALVLAFKGCGH